MAEKRQYLRIRLDNMDFLLPWTSGFAIEKREDLEINPEGGFIAAWRATSAGNEPAYSLDADLNPGLRDDWQRAVFLQGEGRGFGLVAEELQLLSREDVRIEPFRPLGPAPVSTGHLFSGAWVSGTRPPMLVIEPGILSGWLRAIEAQA